MVFGTFSLGFTKYYEKHALSACCIAGTRLD
jgi:hypothetical protein